MRLLLAEDDRDLRELLGTALQADGSVVVAVGNGRDALEQLAATNHSFDVALLDVRMPGLTGLDVLSAARRQGNDVPVVLITSFCDPELEARGLALGATRVLDKLLDLDELLRVVRAAARAR